MRIFLALLMALTFSLTANAQVKGDLVIPKNAKIGLSLSGGGAKGFAHIGVLKVIDSLGVKIDYISGTSMGAIVGGLYASGYRANDIEQIVLKTDFYTLLANEKTRQETSFFNKSVDKYLLTIPIKDGKINVLPTAISSGQQNIYMLRELFKNVSNVTDFSKLPIPFMCVATNLETGQMELFENGDLVSAIMASSAFPSLMDPVKIGDSLYIDGAMTVNYPSKPLKDKGIDIVIGVDLSQGLATRSQLNTLIDILNQVTDYTIQKETKNQYTYTDINIHPNLEGMTATSYGDKQTILDKGYEEALKYTSILDSLPKSTSTRLRAPTNSVFNDLYKIEGIRLENSRIFSRDYVQGKMNLTLPSLQSYSSINKMIDKLYATNNYKLINYDLVQDQNKTLLQLTVDEDETRFFLKFGLHYDEIFKTGLLLNFTAKRLLFRNSTISADVVIGDSPRYYFNYFIDNGYIPGFGVYASGMSYDLKDKNSLTYQEETWFRNELFIQSVWQDRYAIGGGISHDHFESQIPGIAGSTKDQFLNPYAFLKSDTQDEKNFATRGIYLYVEGKLIDLLDRETDNSVVQAKANAIVNIPVSSYYTNRLQLVAGLSLGEEPSPYYHYKLGGIFGQNMANLIPFNGYELGQESGNNVFMVSNDFQFKVSKNFYLIPNVSIATMFDSIENLQLFTIMHSSVGLTAGYKSPFGQIKLNYSKSLTINNEGLFNVILGHWF